MPPPVFPQTDAHRRFPRQAWEGADSEDARDSCVSCAILDQALYGPAPHFFLSKLGVQCAISQQWDMCFLRKDTLQWEAQGAIRAEQSPVSLLGPRAGSLWLGSCGSCHVAPTLVLRF